MTGYKCFVTVGTTKFDELVEAFDSEILQEKLFSQGFEQIVIQKGRSRATPVARGGLKVEVYEYKPSLREDMDAADLIVSHAGAGSVMESLRMGKKLVVVANQALMDNHQMELADAMAARGLVDVATPHNIAEVIGSGRYKKLKSPPPLDLGPMSETVMKSIAELEQRDRKKL
uniref:UDP-N-acetylglucosamine transferase subunit ALG13 n=1 Tax=Hanusia phi TaxID=3032 RepID=A0A7S0EDY8_9CRYP|mmetsp:Transcript_20293/g.46105  ORF Transcript_20293/g.46105 Transcript_20293/m.46105 type:complete len:173 (+) Transcript_20293:78-596(+)